MKAYEAGIEAGHLSTLARHYGDGVVNLSVGNIRPGETVCVTLEVIAGVELQDDGLRFRFPFTLAPSYHSRARSIEVEPGVGELELPEDEFGDVILPRYYADARGLHEVGFDLALGPDAAAWKRSARRRIPYASRAKTIPARASAWRAITTCRIATSSSMCAPKTAWRARWPVRIARARAASWW